MKELHGGGSTGAGAGLTDGLRKALAAQDLERAAAEFELFMKQLLLGSNREIQLAMKGAVTSYKASSLTNQENGAVRSVRFSGKLSAEQLKRIPPRHREVVRRYFSPK